MNMHAVYLVRANRAEPFKSEPFLSLILTKDADEGVRYIRRYPANTSMMQLEAEAMNIRNIGMISQEMLDQEWTLDAEGMAEEEAYLMGNAYQNYADERMTEMEVESDEMPIVIYS